ncbi:hypothetical protein E3T28_14845 [Cryobacterium sinapicolor]|uniref:DUF5047 domain-containing protein n=1 Tax=Cryobacterium sinapicolor TaxID=1259236 RepID=A0ABY2IW69_9MICO|nr:hypothetical protein [Cryobacterium sinapicolor]TFC94577.1 hypothetical protein E3T28_14845 [Cryobacterium sinapicolor]
MITSGSVTATVAGVALNIKESSLTVDDSWSRYGQCDLTIVTPPNTALLDPRLTPDVTLTYSQEYGPVKPVSQLSTAWAGKLVSALSTAWAGKLVSALSTAYGSGTYTAAPYRDTAGISAVLHVRKRTITQDGLTVLHLETHDALLEDLRSMNGADRLYSSYTLRTLIAEVFAELTLATGRSFTLAPGPTDADVPLYPTMKPGQTFLDFFTPYLQQANLRLWCDLDGVFQLTVADAPVAGTIALSGALSVIDAQDNIDRDQDLWADAVVVVYNESATGYVSPYPTDGRPYSKVMTLTVDAAAPFNQFSSYAEVEAAAKNIWTRLQKRGREVPVDAVNDYAARPGMAASITLPGQPVLAGIIRAVTWSTPENTMQVITRDLE